MRAALDIGSNTFRMLVGGLSGGVLLREGHFRFNVRLAEELGTTGRLSEAAIRRGVDAFGEFRNELIKLDISPDDASRVRAVGTSALRDALNTGEFLSTVRQATGFAVEVITGEEEARLNALGAAGSLSLSGETMVLDIGGASSEASLVSAGSVLKSISLDVGVVRFASLYRGDEITSKDAMGDVEGRAADVAREIEKRIGLGAKNLIGTGGSATTLAAMLLELPKYDPSRVHGLAMGVEDLKTLRRRLCGMGMADRRGLKGLENGREDLIIPGIILTIKIMEHLGFSVITASDYGLLEGVLHGLCVKEV